MTEYNSHIRAIHTDAVEVLKRMNTHVVNQLVKRRDAELDYGSLVERAEKIVENPDIELTFYVESEDENT